MSSYTEAIVSLQETVAPTFGALEAGLAAAADQHARASFLRRDDPWYFLHTVRRVACEKLRGDGLQATLDGNRFRLPLSGILVLHRGYAVKVLHAEGGKGTSPFIPIPGRSRPRQAFWRQDALDGMDTVNLLLLWQDDAGVLLDPMTLVKPLGGDHRRDSLRVQWMGKSSRRMALMRAADLNELEPDHEYREIGEEAAG
jgi:hypothetical protein